MVHALKGQFHPIDKTRQLQRKLYQAAKVCRERRFHALYDRIYRPDVLWRAWREVKANGGSAGIDGLTIGEMERQGVTDFLKEAARRPSEREIQAAGGQAGVYSQTRWTAEVAGNTDGERPGSPTGLPDRD